MSAHGDCYICDTGHDAIENSQYDDVCDKVADIYGNFVVIMCEK